MWWFPAYNRPRSDRAAAGHRGRQHFHPARRGENTGNKHTEPSSDRHKQGDRRHDQVRHGASLHCVPRETLALVKDEIGLLPDRTSGSGTRPGQQKPAISTRQGRDRPLQDAVRQDRTQTPAHSAPSGRKNGLLTTMSLTPWAPADEGLTATAALPNPAPRRNTGPRTLGNVLPRPAPAPTTTAYAHQAQSYQSTRSDTGTELSSSKLCRTKWNRHELKTDSAQRIAPRPRPRRRRAF